MQQSVIQIGNSVGVILPKNVREEAGLSVGDKVVVEKENNKIVLYLAKKKLSTGINAKFVEMVDDFVSEHQDVLEELAKR